MKTIELKLDIFSDVGFVCCITDSLHYCTSQLDQQQADQQGGREEGGYRCQEGWRQEGGQGQGEVRREKQESKEIVSERFESQVYCLIVLDLSRCVNADFRRYFIASISRSPLFLLLTSCDTFLLGKKKLFFANCPNFSTQVL